jgi:hypothetical protein
MSIFGILLSVSILVGGPAFLIYSVCVSGSRADEIEELSIQQRNVQHTTSYVSENSIHSVFLDRSNDVHNEARPSPKIKEEVNVW